MKLVMVMYIYVDVLLILNLYVNYFLLLATGRLIPGKWRLFAYLGRCVC